MINRAILYSKFIRYDILRNMITDTPSMKDMIGKPLDIFIDILAFEARCEKLKRPLMHFKDLTMVLHLPRAGHPIIRRLLHHALRVDMGVLQVKSHTPQS